ncbi:ABC transporter substrate-binding protein [Gracilibacillus alcaliphilus]|uniref:ABC transporter substrate-binding protein n=1 Tax=Gracilibacillus alcaliphilus TaxID=1401441 RepID=UPI00195A08ED|nr:extracellular solute-binding protein [Gracilibacillus alcaliphilus]MBM7677709.1 ABC-type glycerol-3-phosphate transport system substrate-binding protein [Gracilibacillus alcaliphilus]
MRNWSFIFLLLLFLVLAACNGEEAANETDGVENTDSSETSGDEQEESEEDDGVIRTPEMDFDLGGRTIKIVSWWDMTPAEDNPDSIAVKQNLDELKEKHNFDVEYIAIDYGEYQERVTASLLAGEPIGDIVRLGKTYTVPTLVQQDLLWPIDEYTKNENAFNQVVTNELYTHEGRGYGFTEAQGNLVQGIFYNRTLMNELGIKPLQDYVDEDNWSWDTFKEVIRSANLDRNNDGDMDTWGLANGSVLERALAANNTSLTVDDQQNLDDPATLEALNFTSEIATEQLSRPTEGGDWTEPSQFFRQGNTLMYAGAFHEFNGFQNDMPEYDLGFVPFPKGPNAEEYYSYEGLFQALTIPKSVDNPEQLLYIWEKMHDIDSIYDYPDQAAYESSFTNEEDIANARTVAENMLVLDHFTFPSFEYYEFEAEILEGTSVSTVVETYKNQLQSAIDEVYGQ